MNTAQEISKIIIDTLKKERITVTKLLQDCGLARGVINGMKTGSTPSADKLAKIALYLGLSTDYLITGEGSDPTDVFMDKNRIGEEDFFNTPQEVALTISELIKNKQISANKMLQDCGMQRSALSFMKTGSMPSADKLAKIASYLGVSIEYLLTTKADTLKTPQSEPDMLGQLIAANIKQLSKQQNKPIGTMLLHCNIGKGFIYDLEKKSTVPSVDKLIKISQYFNVTIDYLLKDIESDTVDDIVNEKENVIDLSQN